MNNEKYNQIIDEAYVNYVTKLAKTSYLSLRERLEVEEFISLIKQSKEFSKKWGLKIEERDLSFKERRDLAHEYAVSHNKLPLCIDAYGHKGIPKYHEVINKTGWNIPTKLITITYKDEKIEIYE